MTNKITKVYKNGVAYDIYASGGAAGTGDVTGPSSSTDADIALFSGSTGKLIKDSGKKLSDYQTALSTQTAYTSKGTATKVPQITTNTLGQVTGITETNISFPVTSVNGQYGDVTVEEGITKIFTLSSTSDLTNAQAVYDWYHNGGYPIISLGGVYYTLAFTGRTFMYFSENDVTNTGWVENRSLKLTVSSGTITSIDTYNRTLQVVSSLPATPDANTIYFITE